MRMTRSIPAAAAMLFATCVHAQSSVTLSGMLDAGITYVSNQGGHSSFRFDDGIGFPNLFILSGREDLGGGTAAIFKLENQFVLGTGSFIPQQSLFSREAFVGLDSDTLGRLTLGRQYDFMVDSLFSGMNDGASMFGAGLYDFRAGPFNKLALPENPTGAMDWDRMGGDMAISNAIKYTSPVYAGFSGGVLYSFGGVPGSVGSNNAVSVGLNYIHGAFGANAAYTNQKYDVGGISTSVRNWGVGAHFDAGPFTTTALFTTVHNSINGGSVWGAQLAEVWHINPFLFLSGSWLYMNGNATVDNNHANQFSAALTYALSKRTITYVSAVWQRANADAQAQINGMVGPDGMSSGPNQVLARVGLKTLF
jgi:predicted porin